MRRLFVGGARFFGILACLALVGAVLARVWVHTSAHDRVYSDLKKVPHCHVGLVLGAGVKPNGELSIPLKDRVDKGIALYRAGKVDKLLMSGDNRVIHYNEPKRMRVYAISKGVPAGDVRSDFAGRRTYDSMYRAKHIFGQRRMIVVSQGWHLDRAVFIGDHIGLEAYGVSADNPRHVDARGIVRELGACVGALVDVYLRQPRPVMGKEERI